VILPLLLAVLGAATPTSSDPTRFAAIARVVEGGIKRGVYPGAVVVIGRRDSVLFSRGFGHLTWSPRTPVPSPTTTRWDLASITKVMATTSAVMVLVDRGQVALDAPVATYLPRFTGRGREQVTVRMLLDHTSGLRAYLAFHRLVKSRGEAVELLYREELSRRPGTRAVYSDLNAILLGLLVEAVTGETLDAFTLREVIAPLGLVTTAFGPNLPAGVAVAPSRMVRGRPEPGRVNDDNAFLFGGIAGHAGLFSTGSDLARLAQSWLRQGAAEAGRWVAPETMREFLSRTTASGSRALGWDTPQPGDGPSSFGSRASPLAYGHTGYTGTMLWIDPERDVFLVFLTNRSLDPRARRSMTALRQIRTELSDLAISAGSSQ
jgi:CubicO group peptidase (beta-lactamase class C family)